MAAKKKAPAKKSADTRDRATRKADGGGKPKSTLPAAKKTTTKKINPEKKTESDIYGGGLARRRLVKLEVERLLRGLDDAPTVVEKHRAVHDGRDALRTLGDKLALDPENADAAQIIRSLDSTLNASVLTTPGRFVPSMDAREHAPHKGTVKRALQFYKGVLFAVYVLLSNEN